jgi:hypothetical protein
MNEKNIVDFIYSDNENARERILQENKNYRIYNGQLKKYLYEIFEKEFKNKKTVKELKERVTPINIVTKIIKKLAAVYDNGCIRTPIYKDETDQENIDLFSESFNIQSVMQNANAYFKLNKHVALEPYLSSAGIPKLRVLPSHTYSVFSEDENEPNVPTHFVKHLRFTNTKENDLHEIWTKEFYTLINGEGKIIQQAENLYKTIPQVYINESLELLYPIKATDIIAVQMVICLLLSDTALAQKYLSWALLVITGVDSDTEKTLDVSAGSIITLPNTFEKGGDVKFVTPQLNAESVLKIIDELIKYLLYTNNLSTAQATSNQSITSLSGFSKVLDDLVSTEDINKQRSYFINAEKQLWDKFAFNILPVFISQGKVDPYYARVFSSDFGISITFPESKVYYTIKDRIENVKQLLDMNLISKKAALKLIFVDKEDSEIDELLEDFKKENLEAYAAEA